MARSTLSAGMLAARALSIISRSRKFMLGSPLPPSRAATAMSRASLVKSAPFFASSAAFLCLMVDHLE